MIHNDRIDVELLHQFYKLKNLVRFNMDFKINTESVAEHSYFVALFTDIIVQYLVEQDKFDTRDALNCLRIALIHDTPEVETSDIPHPVKVNNPEINAVLTKAEYEYIERNFGKKYLTLFKAFECPTNITERGYHLVVKFADILSVLQFAYMEIKMGNLNFEFILRSATKRYKIIKKEFEEMFDIDEFILFEKDMTPISAERWC